MSKWNANFWLKSSKSQHTKFGVVFIYGQPIIYLCLVEYVRPYLLPEPERDTLGILCAVHMLLIYQLTGYAKATSVLNCSKKKSLFTFL